MRAVFADEHSEIDEKTWNYLLAKYEKNFLKCGEQFDGAQVDEGRVGGD